MKFMVGICALAAAAYLAAFAWSFKTASDDRAAAEDAMFHSTLNEYLDKAARRK